MTWQVAWIGSPTNYRADFHIYRQIWWLKIVLNQARFIPEQPNLSGLLDHRSAS
jgi:hypothetical protein